jgi:hypothetical protein
MNDESERRADQRLALELPVEFYPAQEADDDGRPARGLTRNVSSSGVYFETTETMDDAQVIHVRLVIPQQDESSGGTALTLKGLAKVVRVESRRRWSGDDGRIWGVAAQFNQRPNVGLLELGPNGEDRH